MTITSRKLHCRWIVPLSIMMLALIGTSGAQTVKDGGFEMCDTGAVSAIPGWSLITASTVDPAPTYQIVSDVVREGNRALKANVHGLGSNQWDIQVVAESIHVTPGTTYNFSVWAKSAKAGAKVNFTVGNYSYSEYNAIRPATLYSSWVRYSMRFTVSDTQTVIRAPIHLGYDADTTNTIYIDDMRITDVNAGKLPVVVEGEAGEHGSNFPILTDGTVTYTDVTTNSSSTTSPGDTSRVITYHVTFADSGSYNLLARVRVGANGDNDDSFFYGNGFGTKNDTSAGDWTAVNGLSSAGYSDSSAFVDGPGGGGTGVWKWVNLKNGFEGTAGQPFKVKLDSLDLTFQIGGFENGLDIDKLAFGKVWLKFTVGNLDSVQTGTLLVPDTASRWKGPPLGTGLSKFVGCAFTSTSDTGFVKYWNQLTPGNAGKFGSVATSADTSAWNWAPLDSAYNYALRNDMIFKNHNLVWGSQQPSWLTTTGLDSAQQAQAVEQWIRMVGARYPKIDMIDVVNEPLAGHSQPGYKAALGGAGSTGWDWVVWVFTKARQYLPNAQLLLNDYGIINDDAATTSYLQIINILKNKGLIDGIGVQGHRFELESADTSVMRNNLDRLAATGLPVYISELDLGNLDDSGTPDDDVQLQLYKKIFPVLWTHSGVKGITFWGYLEDEMWQTTCYLVRYTGTGRPALFWLAEYMVNPSTGIEAGGTSLPVSFRLEQNYPNPFNPTTVISAQWTADSHVKLLVYDVLGREVAVLADGRYTAGRHSFTFDARGLASGVYFYRLTAGSLTAVKKMMVIK